MEDGISVVSVSEEGSGVFRTGGKLREVLMRARHDSDPSTSEEQLDLDFCYDDCDTYENEIAELYSYSEESEYPLNQKCFEEFYHKFTDKPWTIISESVRTAHIRRLLECIELVDAEIRLKALRSLLYLVQGVFAECKNESEQKEWCKKNVFLLYEANLFSVLIELLCMESDDEEAVNMLMQKKKACSIADSIHLRVIINILYTMIETMRFYFNLLHSKSSSSSSSMTTATPISHQLHSTDRSDGGVECKAADDDQAVPLPDPNDTNRTPVLSDRDRESCIAFREEISLFPLLADLMHACRSNTCTLL